MLEYVNNLWAKLDEYYQFTDNNHAIYAAVTLLHPAMRIARFRKVWAGSLQGWVKKMEANYREVWTTEFLSRLPQNLAHSSSDDSYTREIMGLF
jgi:hypothetical protein